MFRELSWHIPAIVPCMQKWIQNRNILQLFGGALASGGLLVFAGDVFGEHK
jgi:hypothetical protein